MEKDINIHKLTIKDGKVMLDDFKVKGVTKYELKKSSANSPAELLIALVVNDPMLK
ncbi:hypothetical protein KUA25_04420 [Bacteroidales bacterium MSK.15.36]|nr:hypothetical protein [Bacteroidales bacterium MSK.15.36]